MTLKLVVASAPLDMRIAARLRKRQLHGLLEQIEALDLVDGSLRRLDRVEDDEGLPFGFQVRLGHDVDDLAVLAEELGQGFLELLRLDALFEVADIDAARGLAGCVYVSGVQ